MKNTFFYSNIRYLISKNYPSIYSFTKQNKQFKQNTIQDYFNRIDGESLSPKFENVLLFAEIFTVSLDDLVYKDLSKEN